VEQLKNKITYILRAGRGEKTMRPMWSISEQNHIQAEGRKRSKTIRSI
jgi:hypothetical protein